ncbi:hypothetical protein OAL15_02125 [Flavobacteriales bacterium]|nr:hypothetical protein [Flavobacteriales bacterium]
MEGFLFAYLSYSIIVGICLTIFHSIKEKGQVNRSNLAWLILFPAAGLGKWIYTRSVRDGFPVLYSEKWYMWKYMAKVHWGFMALIGIGPLILLILMSLGLMVGDYSASSPVDFGYDQMSQLLEFGLILMLILYMFIMVFVLLIPFLILIFIPNSQRKRIERKQLLQFAREELERKENLKSESAPAIKKSVPLYSEITAFVKSCKEDFATIDKARKVALETVAKYIKQKHGKGEMVNLTFICTHNSRRSQFGQVWAAVAAAHYGIREIQTYSGGTEETAFNKRAVEACKRIGLRITGTVGTNPRYNVRFSDSAGALNCHSKTFDNPVNPQQGFASIMTCSDADENCPITHGAEFRASLTYDDPKIADKTTEEAAKYNERCKQIATEMLYLFSKV